ncbi:MAG: hypothetical protein LAP85_26220 [Acidobacteriia bacterium]|nr:hypothetical protein [Terriglobia bacterium]
MNAAIHEIHAIRGRFSLRHNFVEKIGERPYSPQGSWPGLMAGHRVETIFSPAGA